MRRLIRRISPVRIRWWRDRARPIVLCGLAVYAIGFLLDWPFNVELSWIPAMIGAVIIAIGALCGLLWLVEPAEGEYEEDGGA